MLTARLIATVTSAKVVTHGFGQIGYPLLSKDIIWLENYLHEKNVPLLARRLVYLTQQLIIP